MYLAPLNYDRYFKKVFSEPKIAKRFLEDFFDIVIDEIELLPTKHKVTDNASVVEFDFRCKIKDNYVIIDMQQWYKTDIVKRFYMYHSMNTVLQLEKIPDKNIDLGDNKKKETKDYNEIIPVITFIWFADDNLNFTVDFVSYIMTSEMVHDFLRNKNLWKEENFVELMKEREKCLEVINNKTKKLDFLQQNKLIYAFQPNIFKSKKINKYFRWFDFAEKTKNENNEKSWFEEYAKDDIFAEIITRISTEKFEQSDWDYITEQEDFTEKVKRYEKVFVEEGFELGKNNERYKIAKEMKKKGYPSKDISEITGLPIKVIEEIIENE